MKNIDPIEPQDEAHWGSCDAGILNSNAQGNADATGGAAVAPAAESVEDAAGTVASLLAQNLVQESLSDSNAFDFAEGPGTDHAEVSFCNADLESGPCRAPALETSFKLEASSNENVTPSARTADRMHAPRIEACSDYCTQCVWGQLTWQRCSILQVQRATKHYHVPVLPWIFIHDSMDHQAD